MEKLTLNGDELMCVLPATKPICKIAVLVLGDLFASWRLHKRRIVYPLSQVLIMLFI